MKVSYVLLISLLIVGLLFVPAVSAEIIIDESLIDYSDTSLTPSNALTGSPGADLSDRKPFKYLAFKNIERQENLGYVIIESTARELGYSSDGQLLSTGRHDITYNLDGVTKPGVIYISRSYNMSGKHLKSRIQFFLNEWDNTGLSGVEYVELSIIIDYANIAAYQRNSAALYQPVTLVWYGFYSSYYPQGYYTVAEYQDYTVSMASATEWKTDITVDKIEEYANGYEIIIARTVDDKPYQTTVKFYNNETLVFGSSALGSSIQEWYPIDGITHIEIINPMSKTYTFTLTGSDEPGTGSADPDEPLTLRTGTVTMTDNNGTTITGFEVTAENAYTGQSYTVTTDTDVAVITLPMERSINIRNPQTGVYEEAPVGYYRFFGQSPGYRMLHEDGIQVSVMPEKYGSYQLCDIRVTPESGYLTGKHKFQIRSRSDNSILQSGTISAKSATTGDWYNATVSGGIVTLILPYDTSNSQSQYAGNYYVYATSPGYEDSDYGTQITVMPHTAYEIRDILLTPIGGVPTAGNVTLRIQAFSETGTGIPNAEIFIAGVLGEGADVWDTYTASSTGYLKVSVPGNSTYDIVASGTGYYDSTRRVEVFNTDPAMIEIKLYLSGAPTVEPTTQPTGWVTPPPTQTSPPIQEDNIIGLSVKGLAKGFGIDYDTALLMFGLMIIFGAGGMVMSSVKGGAMEFIAGSIVGTFVAFALGLIPIWIFIIIAVVFGAYVLRVFVQGSQ